MAQGGGPAPILVVLNDSAPNPFGRVLPEILRAEGINTFDTVQLSALDAPTLQAAALVVLTETPLTNPQAALFTAYLAGGGRLVAMRPDSKLNAVLGIGAAAGTTTNGFALINQSGQGAGLQDVTLPFKGVANHYALAGGTALADLYSSRTLSAGRPAVVRFNNGNVVVDLARSTAYTRQGDPAFAGLDRDGDPGYVTSDIFFQTIDLERIRLPHADIQMRLFSRVITDLLVDSQPLPRLWYFPGHRTLMVATADSTTQRPAITPAWSAPSRAPAAASASTCRGSSTRPANRSRPGRRRARLGFHPTSRRRRSTRTSPRAMRVANHFATAMPGIVPGPTASSRAASGPAGSTRSP